MVNEDSELFDRKSMTLAVDAKRSIVMSFCVSHHVSLCPTSTDLVEEC
jgi:hypothetical protein